MRKMLMMLMMIGSLSAQYEVVKKENPITDADFASKTAKGFSVVEFCAGWAGVCSIDKLNIAFATIQINYESLNIKEFIENIVNSKNFTTANVGNFLQLCQNDILNLALETRDYV